MMTLWNTHNRLLHFQATLIQCEELKFFSRHYFESRELNSAESKNVKNKTKTVIVVPK